MGVPMRYFVCPYCGKIEVVSQYVMEVNHRHSISDKSSPNLKTVFAVRLTHFRSKEEAKDHARRSKGYYTERMDEVY